MATLVVAIDDRIGRSPDRWSMSVSLCERVELPGVHAQHRAALHPPRDHEVVARGDGVDLRGVAVHDDVDRLGAEREMVGEVGAETRAMLRVAGSGGADEERRRRSRADQAAEHVGCAVTMVAPLSGDGYFNWKKPVGPHVESRVETPSETHHVGGELR